MLSFNQTTTYSAANKFPHYHIRGCSGLMEMTSPGVSLRFTPGYDDVGLQPVIYSLVINSAGIQFVCPDNHRGVGEILKAANQHYTLNHATALITDSNNYLLRIKSIRLSSADRPNFFRNL